MNYSRAIEVQLETLDLIKRLKPNPPDIIQHSLEFGATYFWPTEFCNLIEGLTKGFPVEWHPTEEEFLSESGFIYLDKPFYLPDGAYPIPDTKTTYKAIDDARASGGMVRDFYLADHPMQPDEAEKLVGYQNLAAASLRNRINKWKAIPAISWSWATYNSEPTAGFVCWAWGERNNLYPYISLTWYRRFSLQELHDDMVIRSKAFLGEWLAARNIAAMITFMNQRVVSHGKERPDRATRRRVSRWKEEPIVNVIRLRRVHKTNPNVEHEQQDWAFQWVVRGHWRHQWYPSTQSHQTIWIAPYAKGPEDKPLKIPRNQVFAVVR